MKIQHINIGDYNIIVSDEEIKEGDYRYHIHYKTICTPKHRLEHGENTYDTWKKIIASTNKNHNLPSIDYNGFEEDFGVTDNVWSLGNKISVTTIHDYEERKDFPNHNEYENKGKQTYVGEIIEVDKGLALKTTDGKIFKTQGSYWFGSILSQDCKLIKKADLSSDKRFSEEDIFNIINEIAFIKTNSNELNDKDYQPFITDDNEDIWTYNREYLMNFIKSLQKPNVTNIEVEMEIKLGYGAGTGEIRPKVINNKIKITKILS